MIQSIDKKPVKTKEVYNEALKTIESLWNCGPKSKEADLLKVLAILVDEYENNHFPIEPPDPVEVIKYRMEQLKLTQKDLIKYLGGSNRAS
jgi:HTH-type transcriptional regulator/antitoxin HigA